MARENQLQLPLPRRGGKRPGAGRRPKGRRPLVSHKARPSFDKPTPVHVTLRVCDHVWNLRSRRCFRRIAGCFERSRGRFGARLVEFSVQGNHLHLIVEADHRRALSRATQGLAIRIARALNALMKHAGRVFSDHYHARLLRTPTELVNAIAYVLGNAARHFGGRQPDPFNSVALVHPERESMLGRPRGWLLRVGWRRARLRRPTRPPSM
jgi:REP element-mobilizing transposase RayT